MSPQQTIAHYRITCKLGEGGMGEVWRATDTKLNREVAIKVLPESFAQDADRLARFTREAHVLASLNHPNIAAVYGVEEQALVMELVDGPTLGERIAEGPVPVAEALEIARQIADALEYAHERGVIHRDLKPANIMTPEGRVKVLDFGLAKALAVESAAGHPASSPTLTMQGTVAGVIMGTAAYMAPEQARGKVVDKRADIFAFGVVLYEMLTGKTLFAAESVSDTLAALLMREPNLEQVPAQVRPLLRSCLEKDPKRRLRDIGDAWRLMEERPGIVATRGPKGFPGRVLRLFAVAMTVVTLALGVALWRAGRPVEHPLIRLTLDFSAENGSVAGLHQTYNSFAISPDGRRLVFLSGGPLATARLATRTLDEPEALVLPGTESGRDPFFSPDGQWIGFFAGNRLSKVPVQGGAPVELCNAGNFSSRGASWNKNGTIVAALNSGSGLVTIPETGGTPQPLTRLRPGEASHRWPQVLPGGNAVLFTAASNTAGMDDAVIEAADLKTGAAKVVQRGGYHGRFVSSGYLVYVHKGVLFGVQFDLDRLQMAGTPVPLLNDMFSDSVNGAGKFDVSGVSSSSGTLIYASGNGATQGWTLSWLDGSGKTSPLISIPGIYYNLVFSPDGRRLAFDSGPGGGDIFVYDLDRKAMIQLSFDGASDRGVWAPDGKHIIGRSDKSDKSGYSMWWMRADGAGQQHLLLNTPNLAVPWSISPDGRRLAYWESSPETAYDISVLPLDTSDPENPRVGKPEPFLHTKANETFPVFSPDGRWIAYRSDESGTNEIYVQPASGNGGKWKVSSGGGLYSIWARNRHQLFYESADNRIMVVEYIADGDSFAHGEARVWYDHPLFAPGRQNLALAADDKRFAIYQAPEGDKSPTRVVLLLNFFDWVKRRIP